MSRKLAKNITQKHLSPFERIKRTNDAGNEYWSSRDFAQVLDYSDYRNFDQVINKARTACFNSGQRMDDHFVDVTEMVELGKGANPKRIKRIRTLAQKCARPLRSWVAPCRRICQLLTALKSLKTQRRKLL